MPMSICSRSRCAPLAAIAIATLAPPANAQIDAARATLGSITVSNDLPTDGETITVDVVLDATNLPHPFFAWNQYSFKLNITTSGAPITPADILDIADQPAASAPTDTTGDGVENFGPFGAPWTAGRRPGAFPGAAAAGGGSQFGPAAASVIETTASGVRIKSALGNIEGRQQAFTTPENNLNIHRGRVYTAFRFQMTYREAFGVFSIATSSEILNIYPSSANASNLFIDNFQILPFTSIPAPTTLAALALAAPLAARRRR